LSRRIPRDLETICLKCLEKDPKRRHRTAEALAGDLRLWLEGRPIKARRASPPERTWRWCRRHPAVAGLLATLALTLATGVVGLLVLLKQAETERTRLAGARRRAEAYEHFSGSTADQLALLFRMTMRFHRSTTRDQLIAELLKLRDSVRDLRNRDILPTPAIGMLEAELGYALIQQARLDDARDLLKQAIADLQRSLEENPEHQATRYHLIDALFTYSELADGARQFDVELDCFEQVATLCLAFEETKSKFDRLSYVYIRSQVIASRLSTPEQAEQQQRCRHLCQQVLGQLLGPGLDRSRDALAPDVEMLARLFHRFDADATRPDEAPLVFFSRETFLSDWLAFSFAPLSPFQSPLAAAEFDRDPEAASAALIAAVRQRCSKLGLDESPVPATIRVLIDGGLGTAWEARRHGRLDEARAIAGRMMPIARRLVQEYPDNAQSYYVLSQPYDQIRKNAQRAGDVQLEEEAAVQAIEAVRRAVALDPDQVGTREHLESLTKRLAALRAKRKAAGSSTPSP
jgi:tetratricopeptide (TPR) repeat protein